MTKKWLMCVLMFVLAAGATASPADDDEVRLSFDRVPVVQLVSAVYGDVLKQNFVLHPSLVDSELKVTLHFQERMNGQKVRKFMASFLDSVGITVQERSGYVFILPTKEKRELEPEEEVFVYRPKFRTASYIVEISMSIFKTGRFSSQRTVRAPGAQQANASAGHQQIAAMDSGSSAYSVQDKGDVDTLVFTGTGKEVETLRKLLAQIDVPVGEVLVKGVVYEVTLTSSDASAYSMIASVFGGRFGINIGQPAAGDVISISTPNFSAALAALSSDNRFKSINNASVRVKSGKTGVLSVGADVPVLGAVTVGAGGTSQQSIAYQQSGVIFNLSPVVRDGVVDLSIEQEVSNFVPTTSGVAGSPTLIKRRISTTVGAANDDVIVLGGLDVDSTNKGASGPGFLSGLFRSSKGDATRTEIVLVLNVHKI